MELFVSLLNASISNSVIMCLSSILIHDFPNDFLAHCKRNAVNKLCIIVNVGKNDDGNTYAASKNGKGIHWSCLSIDISSNDWFYSDSLSWEFPFNLLKLIDPFLSEVNETYGSSVKLNSAKDLKLGHWDSKDGKHVCNKRCVKNYICQGSSMDICGFASIFSCVLLTDEALYKNIIMKQTLPNELVWMSHLDEFEP